MACTCTLYNMRADNKGVPSLCEGQRKFLPDAVCLFRRHLAGQKGLTGMVGDDILAILTAPSKLCILPLGKGELSIGGLGIAHERGNEFTASCLLRVSDIGDDILNRPAAPGMDRNQSCGGDKCHLLLPAWLPGVV